MPQTNFVNMPQTNFTKLAMLMSHLHTVIQYRLHYLLCTCNTTNDLILLCYSFAGQFCGHSKIDQWGKRISCTLLHALPLPLSHRFISTIQTVHLATQSTVLWRKGWVVQPRTSMCVERSSLASRLGYQQLMTASNSPIVGLVCLLYFWCFILKLST